MEEYLQPQTQREAILDMHRDMKDLKKEMYGNGTKRSVINRLEDLESKIVGTDEKLDVFLGNHPEKCPTMDDAAKTQETKDKLGIWITRLTLITMAVGILGDKTGFFDLIKELLTK